MKLTNEQMLEALRDAGHEESAIALEQKMTAEAAVAAAANDPGTGTPAPGPAKVSPPAADGPELTGSERLARAYGQLDAERAGEGK